jgi:hypothetical protein
MLVEIFLNLPIIYSTALGSIVVANATYSNLRVWSACDGGIWYGTTTYGQLSLPRLTNGMPTDINLSPPLQQTQASFTKRMAIARASSERGLI